MGSKGSNTTTTQQNQTYSANPAVSGAGTQAINMATNAANTPFNLPTAPVAGFNPLQQQSFQQYQNLQGMAQPYYNQAQSDIQSSANPLTGQDISQYYNPMASNVLAQLQNVQGQQMNDVTGKLTQTAGGVGADRIAVGQSELANQQNLATGQTLSGLYQNALTAAQQNKQMQANAGYGLTNLGTTAQNAALQGTGALNQAGNQQQAQTQAQLNAPYQNQLAQLAYPFQTAQYLAGITGGLSGALGGTTQGTGSTTAPAPSLWSQILGGATGAAGIAGATGAFGANGWLSGGNPAYGGGTSTSGDAYGGSSNAPLAGLSALDYGAGYASGGAAGNPMGNPNWMDDDPTVPKVEVHSQANPGAHLNLSPPAPQQQSATAGLGDIAKLATTFAPMLLAQGGAVDPNQPFQHFADGGADDSDFANRFAGDQSNPGITGTLPVNQMLNGSNAYNIGPKSPTTPDANPDNVINPDQPYRLAGPEAMQGWRDSTPPPVMASDQDQPANPMSNRVAGPPQSLNPANQPAQASDYTSLDRKLPYPDLNPEADTSRSFAKSPWMALANAGFAMMAGTSPFAGVNIGKGLQEGVKTLEQQRKDLESEEGVNQRAKQLIQQAEFHRDEYNKMTPYQQNEVRLKEEQIAQQAKSLEVRGWIQTSENPVDGSKTFVNKGTMETRTVYADGRVENGSLGDPGAKTSQLPNKDNTPSGTTTPTEASPLGQPELASNLVPPKIDTSYYRMHSPALTQANQENAKVVALHSKEANNLGNEELLVGNSKQAFGTLMKDRDQDGFLTKLATMRGNNIEERIRYARSLNEAATAAGKAPPVNPQKLAAMEVISKDQNTLGMLFASNLSSREAFAGQQVGIASTPGLTQSPLGMLRLLAGYDAQLQYTKDKHAFYENYIKANKGVPTGWEQAFQKQNPPERYIVRSMMENLPNRKAAEKLPEAVKILKDHPNDPDVVKGFNREYGNTASYWLTGHLDLLGAQ